jgi:hypothetical protein
MGCNYYTQTKSVVNGTVDIHIGKSSCGWAFALHDIPSMNLRSFNAWKKFLKGKRIFNEYGEEVSYDEIISTISERKGDLQRHELSVDVRHGEGTYDYLLGYFR